MSLSAEDYGQHRASVLELGKKLTVPQERVYFFSAVGRFLRGSQFESIGSQFLDEALRQTEDLSPVRLGPPG